MSLKEKSESEYKRKRAKSPEFIKGNTDLSKEESGHDEHKNKRVKYERALSPTPSCMSLRSECSMDPLTNFRGGENYPLDYRVKPERAASPTISYMSLRTDWSMDPPSNLRDVPLDTRIKEENETATVSTNNSQMDNTFMLKGRLERAPSPAPSYMSQIYSDWFEGPLTSCKAEGNISFNPRLMTEDHLKCPLCKSMLKDPVSITCGHNYCRGCINAFWDNCAGDFVCPQCGRASETRPVLNTNVALAEVVKDLQKTFSPALPPRCYAGPEDVACDFCTENRLKAVKACSTCGVFLCETHIRQHYTIPALQKHTLRDVTGEDQMKMKLLLEQQKTDSITSGQQNQTDETQDLMKDEVRSISESVLNSSMSEKNCLKEAAEVSRSEAVVNKDDADVRNLAHLCSKLQEEVSGLKKSFSKLKRKKTEKDKYYDEEDDYDDDDGEEENDDEEEDYSGNDSSADTYDMYDDDYGGEEYTDDWGDEEENKDDDDDVDDDDDDDDDDDNEEEDDYGI
ncbi:uncharacterized protein isoform X2 [Danio rerio]|uniref:RING-type domain-containing protein n=2 Tax=Danio rerio TaxID=7955 RepID=A0A8M3B540_DANRE|nr:RING finger protein PSH1 isoform X1 [Danio rerio]XP_017213005.1 RING finger protein PSH1 isoform X1 [Danio rerio]|eukprot:XP_009302442.1 RING finger protein PSH1 isoform X1 [Danio rerio]